MKATSNLQQTPAAFPAAALPLASVPAIAQGSTLGESPRNNGDQENG